MELYLEIGFIVRLARVVFLFLPRQYLGMSFVVKLAYLTFLSPSGLYFREVLCCLVGRHELSFPACRGYM